ncbi:MAG: M23 family metallopeptidase [Gemmatimonadaceae bacterium]
MRLRAVVAGAIAAAAPVACRLERSRPADSTAVTVVMSPGAIVVATPPDSARPPRAAARGDTTPIVATEAELRELAPTLVLPVQGFHAADLRDSYTEPRSGARVHHALDILAPRGTPVVSAADGRVLKLHESRAGGLMVYAADASDRFILMYGHLDRYEVGLQSGMPLVRGQVIGYVGTTGNAPPGTPHLHFVIARGRPSVSWWRGTPVNPYPLLKGAEAASASPAP